MFRFVSALVAAFTLAPAVASAHGPAEPRERPALWQIQRRIDDKLGELESLNAQILDLASRRPSGRRVLLIKDMSHRSASVMRELRVLQQELGVALRNLGGPGHGGWEDEPEVGWPEREGGYVPVPWMPAALPPDDFAFLLASIDQAAFPEPQKNALRDVIRSGGYFDTAQAVQIMQRFPHENSKVDVGALLCPRIIERGALPRLMSTFSFETYRQELRERTGGQCGLVPRGVAQSY